jgi:hypothetical protein
VLSAMKLIALLCVFFVCSGMKLLLRDGNFIDIKKYSVRSGKVYFDKTGKTYYMPSHLVDLKSTDRLLELGEKKIPLFRAYTSSSSEKTFRNGDILKSKEKSGKKDDVRTGASIKLEANKETNPFFIDFQTDQNKGEDLVDKLKKKGIFFKIQIPVEDK